MPQTLKCPSCSASLQYDGRSPSIKCEYCNNVTLIPEEYRHSNPSSQNISFSSGSSFEDLSQSLPVDKLVEINDQLRRGRKIEAIKIFRETFGVGLKEAKEAVEKLERGEAVDLSSQQKITTFHNTFDQGQVQNKMVVNFDTSGNLTPGTVTAGSVPGQVIIGGSKPFVRPKSGCISAFLGQFGCLLFLFFWIPFLIVMVGTYIFPDMVLWTAPIVCDEGYQDAYSERVGYYSTGNFEGNNIVLLHCVYGDGVDEIPHPFQVDSIIFAVPMAFFVVVAFGIALLGRIRAMAST